jgi:hypothetical protein
MGMDLDGWIARVKGGEHLEEWDLKQLCDYVKELLIEESNVQVRKSGTALAGASRPSQLSAIRPSWTAFSDPRPHEYLFLPHVDDRILDTSR